MLPPTRRTAAHTAEIRGAFGNIPNKPFRYVRSLGLKTLAVPEYSEEAHAEILQKVHAARRQDFIWLLGTVVADRPTRGWSGYMEVRTTNLPYETSIALPLPFVNLDPNNPSAIFTSLDFAARQAANHGQQYCPVTFDQPLFWKAADIMYQSAPDSPLKCIALGLGGFHLLMSFLESIGYIMMGSGLEEMWELVYAANSVQQLIGGHSSYRSMRAHYLTQVAMVRHTLNSFSGYFEERGVNCSDITAAFNRRLDVQPSLSEDIDSIPSIENFLAAFEGLKTSPDIGRTGKLWLQYVSLVEMIRLFVRAERSGGWELHLYAVKAMLPLFPAAGHLNYAKSVPLYISLMESLKQRRGMFSFEAMMSH